MASSNIPARIPALDGWRALAIALVLISHVALLSPLPSKLVGIGPDGVVIFFAISGFLITTLLLREEDAAGRISLRGFYVRRAFRILPPAFSYLAAIVLLDVLGALRLAPGEIASAMFFYSPYWASKSWFTTHFWSLSIEEHFYLVWPFVLSFGRRQALWLALAVAAIIPIWRPFGGQIDIVPDASQRTDMRLDSFGLACAAAILIHEGQARKSTSDSEETDEKGSLAWLTSPWVLPVAAVATAAVMLLPLSMHEFKTSFRPYAATILVCATVLTPGQWFSRFLEWEPLAWFGRISYSVYLWQQLILSDAVPGPVPVRLVMIVVAAWLSHRFIEQPFIRLGRKVLGAA